MTHELEEARHSLEQWITHNVDVQHIFKLKRLYEPTLNLNGSSEEMLLEQMKDVLDAFTTLQNCLGRATPHGRDWQTQARGPENFNSTYEGWTERRDLLRMLRKEFEAYAMAINDQRRGIAHG